MTAVVAVGVAGAVGGGGVTVNSTSGGSKSVLRAQKTQFNKIFKVK